MTEHTLDTEQERNPNVSPILQTLTLDLQFRSKSANHRMAWKKKTKNTEEMWLVWKKTPKQSAGELLSRYPQMFIIWPSTIDTEQTSCVSQTGLKGNMYTL